MTRKATVLLMAVCITGSMLVLSSSAMADKKNFDLSGKLYTKYLYRNDDTQGVLWLGNPFWYDDISGNNGIATEFELLLTGNASKYVQAGVKLKSRFGGVWQDWWVSGERKWEYLGEHNTSGDSLGMNMAQYVKFRGFYININPDWVFIDWIKVGATDLGMFNEWTIGKVRYIDRDNSRGLFGMGNFKSGLFRYHAGIIALPKLWVGPGWSTGVGDDKLAYSFYTQDWAYALRMDSEPLDWLKISSVTSYTRDVEFDRWDPDAQGSLTGGCKDSMGDDIPNCSTDHAVGTYPRYSNLVTTLELEMYPNDIFYTHLLGGFSYSDVGEEFVANGVKDNGGMFPIVYKDVYDFSVRGRLFVENPFDRGFSFKFEGFYIGENWNSIFGTRREGDVLLTDGFVEGGQLPTLNLANEFIDFDEPFFESCVGWMGMTLLMGYEADSTDIGLEGTLLGYNTDAQGRDIDETYPTFLYSEGFTDVDLYDYANITDRGRDPRSVYKRDQDRRTFLTVLKAGHTFDFGLKIEGKFKYIRDDDWRMLYVNDSDKYFSNDDYLGNIIIGRLKVSMPVRDAFTVGLGTQLDYWDEVNRSGDLSGGYGDYLTKKVKAFGFLSYRWGGLQFNYYLEYLYKNQERPDKLNLDDQIWRVWRSKATLDVAW